jgi:type IV secretion system protein VirB1
MQDHSGTFVKVSRRCGSRARSAKSVTWHFALLVGLIIGMPPLSVSALPLSSQRFDALAAACAPGISGAVLRAVASKESHFEPLALHDNTKKITRLARDVTSATAVAQAWIAAGDSVDLGLMQINAPNLAPLGMTIAAAFDPCASLAAGAAVLQAAYKKGASAAEQQAALLIALSRYNTGRPLDGVVNGYVADVVSRTTQPATSQIHLAPQNAAPDPAATREWDVWASPTDAKASKPSWFLEFSETTVPPGGSGTAATISLTTKAGG